MYNPQLLLGHEHAAALGVEGSKESPTSGKGAGLQWSEKAPVTYPILRKGEHV
jgi:hypothetical protein